MIVRSVRPHPMRQDGRKGGTQLVGRTQIGFELPDHNTASPRVDVRKVENVEIILTEEGTDLADRSMHFVDRSVSRLIELVAEPTHILESGSPAHTELDSNLNHGFSEANRTRGMRV